MSIEELKYLKQHGVQDWNCIEESVGWDAVGIWVYKILHI